MNFIFTWACFIITERGLRRATRTVTTTPRWRGITTWTRSWFSTASAGHGTRAVGVPFAPVSISLKIWNKKFIYDSVYCAILEFDCNIILERSPVAEIPKLLVYPDGSIKMYNVSKQGDPFLAYRKDYMMPYNCFVPFYWFYNTF